MVEKNDFTIYRKYEDDGRYFNYNFDMIKDRILEVIEGLEIEDKIEEYINDLEEVVEQIVEELNDIINKYRFRVKTLEELDEVIDFAEEHDLDVDSAYIVWKGLDTEDSIKNSLK